MRQYQTSILTSTLMKPLKFVGLNCSETGETVWKPSEPEPTSDNKESPGKEEEDSEDSLDTLNDTLDDMIQASQLHPQHLRSLQNMGHGCTHASLPTAYSSSSSSSISSKQLNAASPIKRMKIAATSERLAVNLVFLPHVEVPADSQLVLTLFIRLDSCIF
ncbi:hypothetical protein O3P69_014572 [Scylla paramamosain]|uniref:Uncharacterized protein n=1 Tax=Scylla paramamosain TaxID=85552 RepID=A0AAW0SEA0_SCYPA